MATFIEDEDLEAIMEKIRIRPNCTLSSIKQMIIYYMTKAYMKGVEEGKKVASKLE